MRFGVAFWHFVDVAPTGAIGVKPDIWNSAQTAGLSRVADIDPSKDFTLAANGRFEPKLPDTAPRSSGSNVDHSRRSVRASYAHLTKSRNRCPTSLTRRVRNRYLGSLEVSFGCAAQIWDGAGIEGRVGARPSSIVSDLWNRGEGIAKRLRPQPADPAELFVVGLDATLDQKPAITRPDRR